MKLESSEVSVGDWRANKTRDKRLARRDPSVKVIDASFFAPLAELINTTKNLVGREGVKRFPDSPISSDVAVMLNQLRITFDLLRFVNGDERRDFDPNYRQGYSFVTLPLIRTLIDGFYNITKLLDDPSQARVFRLSGYKRMLAALRAEESLYGSEKGWTEYIGQKRRLLEIGYTADKFTEKDLQGKASWTLLGTYLKTSPENDSEHKKLIRRFTYGPWREYSEISHVTFRGVHDMFIYLNVDEAPHDLRDSIRDKGERELTLHLGRAAIVMLALVTEIQAAFDFKGHNVNSRLHALWRSIVEFPDGLEMFNLRYKHLMEVKGIRDVPTEAV